MTKHQIIEEPCEVKVSSTVLKTNEFREELVEFNAPNGDRYCLGEIFYSAASAEAKGRKWIEDLREEEDEWELDSDE